MIRLTIATVPPIEFVEPAIIDASFAQLGAGGESPTVEVTLDPGRGEVAERLDPPPLRMAASLDQADGTTFNGIVQSVRLGSSVSLTLEA